ncbi:antibiotic biosynthesis monooxygenase [Magnetovibrio blakemorei]|uniref:Antibiotic biosynthesis monooxygenase n=1 Tax=Magnetovibrio blakemorei TaxID=28181 RepID=A0A1E5Q714_9PROT|nr:antibiotic biosynthesis monooxygenase [Magnetovibrio blakemorei]OEJ66205.1 antibiotic biosynthesis monooxygenase [Magnetovibrio blakemorei]
MPVTLVYISVKPECIDDFISASKTNHSQSVKEPGNHRFDLLQNEADPSQFVFYEWYKSDADIAAHKQTDQYLNWRKTVDPMMAVPRRGVRHIGLCPELNA